MRDAWKRRWGWRVSAVLLAGGVLAVGTGTVGTQASEFDGANNGGQAANHTLRWDQNLPAAQRFVVLAAFNSEAVLDKNTGLVWEKSPEPFKTGTWVFAREACINKLVGGQKGWRLPAIPELASLVDDSMLFPGPTLPPGHPFHHVRADRSTFYWSASTVATAPPFAWMEFFDNGVVDDGVKTNAGLAWCVRGGMNADAY